jgi:alpha-maltose-1-phosphate synthase
LPNSSGLPKHSRLKIAIATSGRFHVLDLARELDALGHEVRFYSYVPWRRAAQFGLARECHVSLLPFVFPLVAWERLLPKLGRGFREWLTYKALNWAVMLRVRRCDVFIFMSGIYVEAAHFAKRRFAARLWLERGSQHILAQDEILAAAKAERPSGVTVRRELAGYAMADRIVIPSLHVEESFRRDPAAYRKLFLNAYGVDTRMFPQRSPKRSGSPMVLLYAGAWSLQKGCDVLFKAVKQLDFVRLVHVGGIGDCEFPYGNGQFLHHDAVAQAELGKFYAEADAFVLASRQDGFGMVLSQALASGLPLIATDRTGAPDLALMPGLAERIFVVPAGDAESLAHAISALAGRLDSAVPFPPLRDEDREQLSWKAYGRRYCAELLRDFAQVSV